MLTHELIDGEGALAEFRSDRFSAVTLAHLVERHPAVLVNAPVGAGKSTLIDDLLDRSLAGADFDLIVCLTGLVAGLRERRLVRRPVPGVVTLRPRPRADCGGLDAQWAENERRGTTAWARRHLCGSCGRRSTCTWPAQYGAGLRDARVVFGTHAHFRANRRFLSHLRAVTGARRILLLLDESDFLEESFRTRLTQRELRGFLEAVRRANLSESRRETWLRQLVPLLGAATSDLRAPGWEFPRPGTSEAVAIQEAGLSADPNLRWIGHDLHALGRSRRHARWRDPRGDVVFVQTPTMGDRTVFFAANLDQVFLRRQLRIGEVTEPFTDIRCQHSGSRFFNVRSLLGAACNFGSNHPQILDAIGQLIVRNIEAGRRTLLVSRKHLKPRCVAYLERRLAGWGHAVSVVASSGEPPPNRDPATVPLIHYGIAGINSFEHFDSVYCLGGYYLDETAFREAVADVEPDDHRFPVSVRVAGPGGGRVAGTFDPRYRFSNGDEVARSYHRQLEAMRVVQAIGRVRPFTKPREVIAFQCGDLPGIELTAEFRNLAELREYFRLIPGAELDRRNQGREALRLKSEGFTVREIAKKLGVSERTIGYRLAEERRGEGPK